MNTRIKVFIDGSAGTTGLRIYERLAARPELELITLPEHLRKDPAARQDAMNASRITFLCLPDAAAIEAVSLIENPDTVVIDTSTAHRTAAGWAYGFPELTGYRDRILKAKRIANPGCHASGFISLAAPLAEHGLIAPDAVLSCFSLTGYSGGGKKMIADYEAADTDADTVKDTASAADRNSAGSLQAPRAYGLSQKHKHLPEMAKISGLTKAPLFTPIVSSYYAGMEVVIQLPAAQVQGTPADLKALYRSYYTGPLVHYTEAPDENGFLSAGAFAGRDDMELSVFGSEDRILLVSRFDNLGKGASGAAIQNMNLVLGLDETAGLNIPNSTRN